MASNPSLRELLQAARALIASPSLPAWPQRDADLALLDDAAERLDRRFTLAIVGEFSSGKSYFLNALLGRVHVRGANIEGLLTVDINPSTATITELEFSEEESALARYPSGRQERVPLDALARFVAVGNDAPGTLHDATTDDDSAPTHVSVRIDSPFLKRGFVIADTPGLASLNPAHRRATLGYLPRADAVLYLIDTQQPFTDGDAAFLGLIGEHVRAIFILQTKIDLWRAQETNGREAWENARDRIIARAAQYAPTAAIFTVSSRDFALAQIESDATRRERSGFPALLAALDRSLEDLATKARAQRAIEIANSVLARASKRLEREHALASTDPLKLREQRESALADLGHREAKLTEERDDVNRRGLQRIEHAAEQGKALNEKLARALTTAFDINDIDNIRDRGKLHVFVDAIAARVFGSFADDMAADVARELEHIVRDRPHVRMTEIAALALGGEPGTGAWSRDLAAGIRSTIILGAIGGPTVTFVHGIGTAFASHRHEMYMKRELTIDLRERFFPHLATDVDAFVRDMAQRVGGLYAALAAAIESERETSRAEMLDPIDRALALTGDQRVRQRSLAGLADDREAAQALCATLTSQLHVPQEPLFSGKSVSQALPIAAAFDADAYQSGLNPQRRRVVVLGALRRGKSSLINAIAQRRLLQDLGNAEAIFPIHVRFGAQEHAYALLGEGLWHEIGLDTAMAQAAQTPVLIEVPWKMPRELVIVHAPAFDSGNGQAEEISLTAAAAADEVVALFSRQLSAGELAFYARVATFGNPLLFAHTIADNENASERRTVVQLAQRYLQEHGIPFGRIFTVSARDYYEATLAGHAPAAWNELGALRETLAAHAEEHMERLARRPATSLGTTPQQQTLTNRPFLLGIIARLFGQRP